MVDVRESNVTDESYRQTQTQLALRAAPNHWFEPPNCDGRAETSAFLYFSLSLVSPVLSPFILIWSFLLLRLYSSLYISSCIYYSLNFFISIFLSFSPSTSIVVNECFVYRFNLGLEFVLFLSLSLSHSTQRSVDPHFLLVCTKLKRKKKSRRKKDKHTSLFIKPLKASISTTNNINKKKGVRGKKINVH